MSYLPTPSFTAPPALPFLPCTSCPTLPALPLLPYPSCPTPPTLHLPLPHYTSCRPLLPLSQSQRIHRAQILEIIRRIATLGLAPREYIAFLYAGIEPETSPSCSLNVGLPVSFAQPVANFFVDDHANHAAQWSDPRVPRASCSAPCAEACAVAAYRSNLFPPTLCDLPIGQAPQCMSASGLVDTDREDWMSLAAWEHPGMGYNFN